MIVKNLTTFGFGTKVTSRTPPRPDMMLVVKAVFELRPGAPLVPLDRIDCAPSGDVFEEDDDDRSGEVLLPNDFADYKRSGEVLLKATFHSPKKRAVREAEASIAMGKWKKTLRVVGPRVWVDDALGSTATEPAPFNELPLRWKHAYGGDGFLANPVGKGHTSKELPQIEQPGSPVKSRGDHNVAAAFGGINRRWPARANKVGTEYGKEWEATRAPFVARDFDPVYHQAAPLDQRVEGYFRGDEELTFENLHPDASSFSVKLPGLRVRAFGRKTRGETSALPMVLDTIVADVEKGRLSLVWRGHLGCSELDLRDVRSLLIASEPIGAATIEQEYIAILDAFEKDPIGMEEARAQMMAEMLEGIPEPLTPPPAKPNDPVSAAVAAKVDGADVLKRHIAAGMATVVAAAQAGSDKNAMAELEKSIAAARAADDDEPPMPIAPKPGAMPSTGLRRRMRGIMGDIARVRAELAGKPVPEDKLRELDKLDKIPHDPGLKRLDPEYTVPEPLSADRPGPGANLVDHDLTGADLSGLDLSGARLDGAVLTRAKLVGTKLRGASLRGAVLFKTDASGADFEGADFTRANLARLHAPKARFARANFELAFLEDAVLAGASLEEAKLEWTAVARADLSSASARGARVYRADLADAVLRAASFAGGSLRASVLSGCDAEGADFTGTEVRAISAERIRLRGAKLVRAHGERAMFRGADLSGADLSLAVLPTCHFTEATLRGADLYGADLRNGRFDRADLSEAKLDGANLFGGDLRAARVDRTKFNGANLYDAKLVEAAGEGADFSGANLERCVITRRRSAEGEA